MKRSILALASGAFILGAAEFVMMGILPQTATAMHVSIPAAGHYISAYAIGVCVGTLILVFGRKVPPKHLIILFMAIALVGNTLSAVSFCSPMLLVARFISGLPHGAFFGTATLIAKTLADKGKEAQSVSMMVMGQTVANMLGVPAGTLLAEAMSWRLAFAILAAWALMTIVVVILWVPSIDPDQGRRHQGAVPLPHPSRPVADSAGRVLRQFGHLLLVELRVAVVAENRRMVGDDGADTDGARRPRHGGRRHRGRQADRPVEGGRDRGAIARHRLVRTVAGLPVAR